MFMALRIARKKSVFISRPAWAPDWLSPPDCWNRMTRKPSKPELRRARRYSASYMPKRQGPQAPAVTKMWLSRISWRAIPPSSSFWRCWTRLPTVK